MPPLQAPFISVALSRLRGGVVICGWVVGVSLVTQLLIWCIATFMDVRYEVLQENAPAATIVSAKPDDKPISTTPTPSGPTIVKPVDVNRVRTSHDSMMAEASTLAMGAGSLAMIVLLPLLALGVILGAGSCTPGVERTVSAFMWALLVALLVLPLGGALGLPWREGALVSYATMSTQVDVQLSGTADGWGGPMFYARFALLPLASVVGITMVCMRFCYGISAGIPKEDIRLDEALEKEAANITPSSLHAGRASAAFKAASVLAAATAKNMDKPLQPQGGITQISAGEAPKRLI
ncbi:MAG: hypothetical protein L0Y44_12665 [Phycisphaerales bacterium]|nr:hypothetical protein [Phycisphaerales bacterium]MCI0631495.1 hypothetical protein [Phycisphaerales bacterium]MCI0677132.1 hypothetical protein [Phycisphaerales bacterium]